MIAVIDTSAAVAVALDRPDSKKLQTALADAEQVVAPELFAAEVVNTFWKYHHVQSMPLPECQDALDDALAIPDELVAHHELCREVFSAACHSGSPAYDLFFLVLARRYDAILLTLDAKLARLAAKLKVRCL